MISSVPHAAELIASRRPLVIGHRGYSEFAPENTLAAFRQALAAGVDLVELDYQQCRTGELQVIHDQTLDRTTNAVARGLGRHTSVASRTAREIRGLDAGAWFSPSFAGLQVPLLSEALSVIQQGAVALIERKSGDSAATIKVLCDRRGLGRRAVVQAFDWRFLGELHALAPALILGALGPPTHLVTGARPKRKSPLLDAEWLDALVPTGARVVGWSRNVSRAGVKLAHRRGLKVWIYTVNQPRMANELLDLGVDGLITNNPAVIWKTLALRGFQQG